MILKSASLPRQNIVADFRFFSGRNQNDRNRTDSLRDIILQNEKNPQNFRTFTKSPR